VIYFFESVEVLYNLSLNYNEMRSYNLRELLRVGRRFVTGLLASSGWQRLYILKGAAFIVV